MFEKLYNYMEQGGIIMIPIMVSSLISLTFFIERLVYLRKKNVIPLNLMDDIIKLVKEKKISEALTLVTHNKNHAVSRLTKIVLENWNKPKNSLKEIVEEKGKKEIALLEKYIGIIGIVATIAPLMGLLGTVSGMMSIFSQYVYSNQDPTFMSAGISEALITTIAGLIVAIPAVIMNKYLLSKVDDLKLDLEHYFFELTELKDEI